METSIPLLLGWLLILGNRCSVLAMWKQTGTIGETLYIGSIDGTPSFGETLPGAIGDVSCVKSGNDTTDMENYDTEIHSIVDNEYKEEVLSDYFIQVFADVYDCKIEVDKEEENEEEKEREKEKENENYDKSKIVNFKLIYQRLLSIEEIFEVEFNSGIQVSVKKFDVDRVQVDERKCFLPQEDELPQQFECEIQINSFLGIEQLGDTPTFIPNLERKVFKYETVKEDGYEKYQPVADTKQTISADGRIILIEKSPSSTGEPSKKYDCQYPTFLNTELFLPKYYQKFGNLFAVIPEEEFQNFFMIVEREVRVCQCHNNDEDIIYRVKHTVIGTANVSVIEHGTDVVELYVINLPDTGKSIRYTEIKYFDADTRKLVDNNVYFKLANSTNVVESKVVRVAEDGSSPEVITDIQYQLPPSSIYRTMVQDHGFNLRIGSKTEGVMRADYVVCEKDKDGSGNYLKPIWPVIEVGINEMNGVQHALVSDDELINLFTRRHKSWSCQSPSNQNVSFTRAESFLTFTVPVHYVEYYDGVDILWPKRREDGLVRVVEVKFISGGKVIRFEGQLVGQTSGAWRMYTLEENQGILLPKEGDIYPLPASEVPVRKNRLQDYKWDGKTYETTVIEDKENSLEFIVNGTSGEAEAELKLIICEIDEEKEKQLPEFKVIGITVSGDTREKYLTEERTVIWLCKDGGKKIEPESTESAPDAQTTSNESPTEVIRIVTNQNLEKTNPGEVGKIKHSNLDKIWLEMADTDYNIEIEGTRYYSKTGLLQKQLNSFVIFEDKKRTGSWKSGTKHPEGYKEKSKTSLDVLDLENSVYNLNENKVYVVNFPEDMRKLQIGYKYSEIYGNRTSKLNCVEDPTLAAVEMNNKASMYRTQLLELGNREYHYLDLDDVFRIEAMKIWNCTDEDTGKNIQGVMQTLTLITKEFSNIRYLDGVTVLHGKDENSTFRTEFTEFKYLNEDHIKVKYEGKVNLNTAATLQSKLVDSIFVSDVFYMLADYQREIYRTKLESKGATLEMGDSYKSDPHETLDLRLSCSSVEESTAPDDLRKLFPSKVIRLDSENSSPIREEESQFFTTSRRVFSCQDLNKTEIQYYRVVNQHSTITSKPIKQIYHFDGVTIRYNHESHQFEIEDIRYLLRIPGTNGKDSYEPIRLRRIMQLPMDEIYRKFKEHRENIGYLLDRQILLYSNLVGTGRTIELESDYQTTIQLEEDDYVTCRLIQDRAPDPDVSFYNPKVCLNPGSEDENIYVDIMDEGVEIKLSLIVQEQWLCTNKAEDVEFIRLQNKFVSMQLTDRYYYNTNVLHGTLFLPNGEKAYQFTHLKYVIEEDGENKTAKFVGKILSIMDNIPGAESFMNDLQYFQTALPMRIIEVRPRDLVWSLDSLRLMYILLTEDEKEAETTKIRDLGFSKNPYSLRTQLLDPEANRMFQFGRFYEEKFKPENDRNISCIKFPWDPTFMPDYLPRVGEYNDGRLYMMNKDMFNEAFEVLRMQVFLCTNAMDEMLFVETIYKSKIPIFAARLTDGTAIKALTDPDGSIHYEVHESVYMDVSASKVLAYDGELPVIEIRGSK